MNHSFHINMATIAPRRSCEECLTSHIKLIIEGQYKRRGGADEKKL